MVDPTGFVNKYYGVAGGGGGFIGADSTYSDDAGDMMASSALSDSIAANTQAIGSALAGASSDATSILTSDSGATGAAAGSSQPTGGNGATSAQSQSPSQSPFPAGCDANCQALQITVTGNYMDAPNSPMPTGFNYSPIFASPQFTQYARPMNFVGKGFLVEIGVVVALPAVFSVPSISISLPSFSIPGPVLGAAMELGSSYITGVTEVSEWAEAAQGVLEQAGAEYRALELANPEVAGPELPWGAGP
jgi:hypothetical protein